MQILLQFMCSCISQKIKKEMSGDVKVLEPSKELFSATFLDLKKV